MNILKTPDSCFANLQDYAFDAHFINVGDETQNINMHYLDEGDANAPVLLLLHGEPSWSYLYRHMTIEAVNRGFRVIAPDLIGFGKSDKPSKQADYSYAGHLRWLSVFVESLHLTNIHLLCQDWGGLLGLRLVAKWPQKFTKVVASNTFLPTGDQPPGQAFEQWLEFSQSVDVFPVGMVIQKATCRDLSVEEIAAYDAPFPTEEHKAGVRAFPMLVPITPNNIESQNNRDAWHQLAKFNKPFLTLFSDSDPVTAGGEKVFQKLIPGCTGQPHQQLKGGGHFLQEDVGIELIGAACNFYLTD